MTCLNDDCGKMKKLNLKWENRYGKLIFFNVMISGIIVLLIMSIEDIGCTSPYYVISSLHHKVLIWLVAFQIIVNALMLIVTKEKKL